MLKEQFYHIKKITNGCRDKIHIGIVKMGGNDFRKMEMLHHML